MRTPVIHPGDMVFVPKHAYSKSSPSFRHRLSAPTSVPTKLKIPYSVKERGSSLKPETSMQMVGSPMPFTLRDLVGIGFAISGS